MNRADTDFVKDLVGVLAEMAGEGDGKQSRRTDALARRVTILEAVASVARSSVSKGYSRPLIVSRARK